MSNEEKTYLGNCLIASIYFWLITKNSRIVFYWNNKYRVISFYVVVKNEYAIKFRVCKDKKKYCKVLFYVYPTYKRLT